ncbi:MAG: hypothetical protein NTZ83_01485 [Candidatus Pacearchaeota archaeon]|nr:hypothetical protein [Candidatus Pacearchaeota archaeon]
MARKKRVVRKRSSVKAKSSRKPQADSGKIFSNFKLGLVVKNLVLFVLLFLIAYILSVVIEGEVLSNLLYFLWIIFAFIALAFFLALLVLLVLKWIKR